MAETFTARSWPHSNHAPSGTALGTQQHVGGTTIHNLSGLHKKSVCVFFSIKSFWRSSNQIQKHCFTNCFWISPFRKSQNYKFHRKSQILSEYIILDVVSESVVSEANSSQLFEMAFFIEIEFNQIEIWTNRVSVGSSCNSDDEKYRD